MRKLLPFLLVLASLQSAHASAFATPVKALPACKRGCFEPTVAVDSKGRIFVTDGAASTAAISTDAITYTPITPPRVPQTFSESFLQRADALVQADTKGHIYFSALVGDDLGLAVNGIQVARTSDGGKTWDSNILIGAPGALWADRQWLAFGAQNEVYLSYKSMVAPRGVPVGNIFVTARDSMWLARSTDGGRSFGAAQEIATATGPNFIAGAPQVGNDGTVYIPYFANDIAPFTDSQMTSVEVAISHDRGATFTHSLVTENPAGEGDFFPQLDLTEPMTIAWHTDPANDQLGEIRTATSTDGGATWSAPARVSDAKAHATPSPWIGRASDGSLQTAWFEQKGSASTFMVDGIEIAHGIAPVAGRVAATDLAQIARLPDGRLLAIWCANGYAWVSLQQ